jgi:SAM-dependent methyltransferase
MVSHTPHSPAGVACRMCGAGGLDSWGALPQMARFAGTTLAAPLAGGQLLHCPTCSSLQRHPVLSADEYLTLYRGGSESVWAEEASRPDHIRVAHYIAQCGATGSILDVGCNTGRFLAMLPQEMAKHGIEPSIAAAKVATQAGVEIIGPDIFAVPADQRFDCITLIDVVEHLPEPGPVLERALMHLSPGGRLVISTGDPNSDAWRTFRSRFWYCSFAEHVSFPSRNWFALLAEANGGILEAGERFRYGDFGLLRTAVKRLFQITYKVLPPLAYLMGWLWRREQASPFAPANLFLPCAGVYVDHQLISIARTSN